MHLHICYCCVVLYVESWSDGGWTNESTGLLVSVVNVLESIKMFRLFNNIQLWVIHDNLCINEYILKHPKNIPFISGHNWIMVLFTKAHWIANLIFHFYEIFLSLLDGIQDRHFSIDRNYIFNCIWNIKKNPILGEERRCSNTMSFIVFHLMSWFLLLLNIQSKREDLRCCD